MSASDSDYSIDWLASDEDDDDSSSPTTLSPRRAEESPPPPSPPSLRESPTSCFHSQRKKRRRSDYLDGKDRGRCGVDADSPVGPLQGFTPVSEQLSAESRRRSSGLCEKTPADSEHELFSRKCAELQRYVQPLSSILQGLRSGRYSERLSSVQESVATDRIQRIMGVLQNPNTGGRFLSIILKIEAMLHSWFPLVGSEPTHDGAAPQKHHGGASSPPSSAAALCSSDSSRRRHASTALKTPEPTPGRPAASSASASPPPARRRSISSQEVTQDAAVSSSTDSRSGPPRRLGRAPPSPPPFKIRLPCLERLLQTKESIVSPQDRGTRGAGGPERGRLVNRLRPDLATASTQETTRP